MRILKLTAVAMGIGVCVLATSAMAYEPANDLGCLHAANNVRAAIKHHDKSPKLEDAKRQARYGRRYCDAGYYRRGLAYYGNALKLLNTDPH